MMKPTPTGPAADDNQQSADGPVLFRVAPVRVCANFT